MGNSKPPKAQFDLIGSYARNRGTDVEIVIAGPDAALQGVSELTLRRAGRDLSAPAELRDGRLVAHIPRSAVSDGIWNVRRDPSGGDENKLDARLLVQGKRPLVLLWGGLTPSRVVPKAVRHLPAKNRAGAQAGQLLDAALSRLPDEQAHKVRDAVRTRARKALG